MTSLDCNGKTFNDYCVILSITQSKHFNFIAKDSKIFYGILMPRISHSDTRQILMLVNVLMHTYVILIYLVYIEVLLAFIARPINPDLETKHSSSQSYTAPLD